MGIGYGLYGKIKQVIILKESGSNNYKMFKNTVEVLAMQLTSVRIASNTVYKWPWSKASRRVA